MADKETREENLGNRATRRGGSTQKSEVVRGTSSRMADHADEISDTPLSMTNIRGKLLHGVGAKVVLGLLIFIFAIAGALFSARPPAGIDADGSVRRDSNAVVATVNGESITRDRFDRSLVQMMSQNEMMGQKAGPLDFLGQAQGILTNLAGDEAVYQAAIAAGIAPTDADVDKEIERLTTEEIDRQKNPDPGGFRRKIEAEYPTGETGLRDELKKQFDRELVRRSLVTKQYEEKIKADNKVGEAEYKASVTKLGLRQIVVRPAPPGPADKDFAKAQEANGAKALKEAEALAAKLKGLSGPALTKAFAEAAKTKSADVATKSKGGVVGEKLPSELPVGQSVKDALQKATGNLVGPVQDDATKDVYLFLIEKRSLQLPKDYAKKKAELIKNFETQSDNEAWQKKQDEIKKGIQPEIQDPALLAYKTQTEKLYAAKEAEKAAMRSDILAKYEEALSSANPLEKSAIRYQMAQVYRDAGDKKKALEALQAAAKDSDAAPLKLELARALRDNKQNKEALAKLNEIAKSLDDNPSAPSMFGSNPDDAIRMQLAMEYEQMGDKKKAEEQRKKIKPAAPGMGGMGGFGGMGGNSPISIAPGQ